MRVSIIAAFSLFAIPAIVLAQGKPTLEYIHTVSETHVWAAHIANSLFTAVLESGDEGKVTLYDRTIGWVEVSEHPVTTRPIDDLSEIIAGYGDTLIIGVPIGNSRCSGCGQVDVYMIEDNGKELVFLQSLVAPSGAPTVGVSFGSTLAIHGDNIIVGDPTEEKVYLYTRPSAGGSWSYVGEQQEVTATKFAGSVAINDKHVLVGAVAYAHVYLVDNFGASGMVLDPGYNTVEVHKVALSSEGNAAVSTWGDPSPAFSPVVTLFRLESEAFQLDKTIILPEGEIDGKWGKTLRYQGSGILVGDPFAGHLNANCPYQGENVACGAIWLVTIFPGEVEAQFVEIPSNGVSYSASNLDLDPQGAVVIAGIGGALVLDFPLCQAGTAAERGVDNWVTGDDDCTPCLPGSYAPTSGLKECRACQWGASDPGSSFCPSRAATWVVLGSALVGMAFVVAYKRAGLLPPANPRPFPVKLWSPKGLAPSENWTVSDLDAVHVDVLVVVVNDRELHAALSTRVLKPLKGKTRVGKAVIGSHVAWIGRMEVAVVAVVQAPMGALGAAQKVTWAVQTFRPRLIANVGVCFGKDPTRQALGDVIIASAIVPYAQQERVNPDGSHSTKAAPVPTSPGATALLKTTETDWDKSELVASVHDISVRTGELLSGPILVDNLAYKTRLFRQHPKAIAGEMEGAGVAFAAHSTETPMVVVKAISDWGDGTKTEDWQPWAAALAVSLLASALRGPSAWVRGDIAGKRAGGKRSSRRTAPKND